MCKGEDAEHETRLLRIIDTLAACGDVQGDDLRLFREAVEDGLRARDLLKGRRSDFDVCAERSLDARSGEAEVDAYVITFNGAFESAVMRRWANR